MREELTITADPQQLPGVRGRVERFAAELGFSEMACAQIALAIDEALANVIRHGYGGPCGQPIYITAHSRQHPEFGSGLEVIIRDMGRQVDLATIKSRALDEIRPGGLGVHIIQSVMDEAIWAHAGSAGMILTMRKFVNGPHRNDPNTRASSSTDAHAMDYPGDHVGSEDMTPADSDEGVPQAR